MPSPDAPCTRRFSTFVDAGRRACVDLHTWLENEKVVGGLVSLAGVGGGLLFLAIALVKPWYSVPIDITPDASSVTGFRVVMQESRFTLPGRLVVLAAMGSLGLLVVRSVVAFDRFESANGRVGATRIVSTLLVLLLFFPWLAMTWEVPLAAHAAWLQDQHYNLTWLGGDVYNNAEGRDDIAKTGMMFSDNALRTGVYALPDSRVGALRLASFGFVLEWLGYGMAFTQFDGQGWVFACAGCLVLLIGLIRTQPSTGRIKHEWLKTMALPATFACGLGGASLMLPIACGRLLDHARLHHARGENAESLRCLNQVEFLLPVLAEHSQFVLQKGYLLADLGDTESRFSRLVQGVEMERRGMLSQAEAAFFNVLDDADGIPSWKWDGVTREAFRALVRAAIEDFNSGQNVRSHELFRILRDRCRNNLKVNVAFQFAALRMDRPQECTEQVNRIYTIYQGFDALDSRGVRSLVQANAARAHFLANHPNETAEHQVRTIRP